MMVDKISIKKTFLFIGIAFLFFVFGGVTAYYLNLHRENRQNADIPLFRNPDSPPHIIGPSGPPPTINNETGWDLQ